MLAQLLALTLFFRKGEYFQADKPPRETICSDMQTTYLTKTKDAFAMTPDIIQSIGLRSSSYRPDQPYLFYLWYLT